MPTLKGVENKKENTCVKKEWKTLIIVDGNSLTFANLYYIIYGL